MANPPSQRSSTQQIARFLDRGKAIRERVSERPRLIFAVDATASRQPTWDRASRLQQEMFRASRQVAQLAVQVCHYRGLHEFRASPWLSDSAALAQRMARVHCEGGHTQIGRLLRHALGEHRESPVRALVFVGDALEENPDTLCDLAGQCGLRRLPLFLFQEGHEPRVEQTFRDMARLSGGAWARFDNHSADILAQLLGAAARYAAGGLPALQNSSSAGARLLLRQLRDR